MADANRVLVTAPDLDYTPEQIMEAIAGAMKAGDMEAAAALLVVLAVKDPDSAGIISMALDARRADG